MKTKFFLNKASDEDALFCNLSELLFDLDNQLDSPEVMIEKIEQMFLAASQMNPAETAHFKLFIKFFKDVQQLLRADEENYYDYKYELQSYENGRYLIDEKEGLFYFDHPYHQEYFKTKNQGTECITVTK